MEFPDGFWLLAAIVVIGGAIVFYLRLRRSEAEAGDGMADTGSAIVTFSRAFPELPVRNVVMTKDGHSAFLRLADGRVGFVEHTALHAAARLLEPRELAVGPSSDTRTVNVAFPGAAGGNGHFEFASVEDAAEVSLWLCGEFAAAGAEATGQAGHSDRE
ncbi:hypothetical protein [Nitratireductor sp. XY-223]|uniref:hypothetical protein n=1 Tax=Nitratireductor sp. XY-223 TaxID=2561926 RepID=UPI0010A9EB39|nr:hypothetical protein [Nitratireductor sp. XY-223]